MNAKQYKCAKRIRWQLKVDAPTMLSIAAAAALCVFAAALAYDSGSIADPAPMEDQSVRDGEVLLALYETAEMHRGSGQDAKAGEQEGMFQDEVAGLTEMLPPPIILSEQEEMFQDKAAEVASRVLDVEVSYVYAENFFGGPMDPRWNPGQVCGSAGDIPAHLVKVRDAEWYAAFMEKYSAHPIEMHLNDERPTYGFHYGFVAKTGDASIAYTHFHVDTCSGEVTDPASYFLRCYDEDGRGSYESRDYDATAASLELEDFCVIPVSPWRLSVYEHLKEFEGDLEQYLEAVGKPRADRLSDVPEEARLDSLKSLAYQIYHNYMADEDIQGNILHYCSQHGPLPEDFAALIESGEPERSLSAC